MPMTKEEPVTTADERPGLHLRTKPLLSVEETAELLAQSRSSVYRAIGTNTLPLPRIGGRYRIARVAVERLIDGQSPSSHAR
jgi:excisionase family DNA binding protein